MKRRSLTEWLGWYGLIAILSAYLATNAEWIALDSLTYRILNLTGAIALIADSWPDRNWQIVVLNAVWAAIAVIALLP